MRFIFVCCVFPFFIPNMGRLYLQNMYLSMRDILLFYFYGYMMCFFFDDSLE